MNSSEHVNDGDRRAQAKWIWPIPIPQRVSATAYQLALKASDWLRIPYRWILASLIIGIVPLLVSFATGLGGYQAVTAVLLAPLLLAAILRDSLRMGLGVLAVALLSHNALAIMLAAQNPEAFAEIFPAGAEYWETSHTWITTGRSLEYDVTWWLPAHFQLLFGVAFVTYVSMGWLTLWHGLVQLDLMNFYVGQLVANSSSPWIALGLGWHPWSICRGIGYVFLCFEVTSYSFERLTGQRLSTRQRRICRWSCALGFLVADGIVKYTCLESVRVVLESNLKM